MDWLATLEAIAPTVASAFLGPLGGEAVSAIGNLLGVSDATQETIAATIQEGKLTPEQIGKLKELELEYQNNEKERDFKYADLEFKDKDSARSRDVEYVKAGRKNIRADILAYGALIAFCLSGWELFTQVLPDANRELIVYLLGALTVIVKDLYGFEFGSSRGSQDKNEILAQKGQQ